MKSQFLFFVALFISGLIKAQSGLIPCGSSGKMGYCNLLGVSVIEPVFEATLPFEGSIAPVVKNGTWWFISAKGHLRFNSRIGSFDVPPKPEQGLYAIRYFDPIFADVTEYYNRNGFPVKVTEPIQIKADTILYSIFRGEDAIALAKTKLGLPYGAEGLDCSGFIRFVYANFGIVLPYFAREIAEKGREIEISKASPGDLIFFTGFDQYDKTPNHVGLVVTSKAGVVEFIHTSTSRGVKINKNTDPYFKVRYLKCRRVFG